MGIQYNQANPNPALSGIAITYGTGGPFVYDRACPVVQVPAIDYEYATFDKNAKITRAHKTAMPYDGPYNEMVTPGITWTEGKVRANGLKTHEKNSTLSSAVDPGIIREEAIATLTAELRLGMEAEFKAALDAATNATTLAGALQWNNASATIEKSIDSLKTTYRQQTRGLMLNTLIVPEACWVFLKRDSTIRDALKYTSQDVLNGNGGIPQGMFGIANWIVPEALLNSANPGATASVGDLWSSDKVYALHVNPAISTNRRVQTSAFLAMTPVIPELDLNFGVEEWDDERTDVHWTWWGVGEQHDMIVHSDFVHRLDDVLA